MVVGCELCPGKMVVSIRIALGTSRVSRKMARLLITEYSDIVVRGFEVGKYLPEVVINTISQI